VLSCKIFLTLKSQQSLETHSTIAESFNTAAVELCDLIYEFLPRANPNTRTLTCDKFPLLLATENKFSHIVEILLDAGADTETRELVFKITSLHVAVHINDYVTARILLEHQANPNVQDWEGKTPLHYAACNGNSDMVVLLLGYNANPLIRCKHFGRNIYNLTPLEAARQRLKKHHGNDMVAFNLSTTIKLLESHDEKMSQLQLESTPWPH
jgi:hypothetical protein